MNLLAQDEKYMKRALELAVRGAGMVSPNPMVGAVIVHQGRVIGEGWHERYGDNHAEVNAVNSVVEPELLPESTIYVTLEPCSHWGKTPPCCDLIIARRIKRAIVGCIDPFHEVKGGGIARMREAGVDVTVGVMEDDCVELNKRFFKAQVSNRPYVILKWAETCDGFIDAVRPAEVPPAWMTGDECRLIVHRWRAEEDAIMVGRRTVEMDDPSLTVREVEGHNPLRITLDRNLVLDTRRKIFDNQAPTVLFTDRDNRSEAVAKFSKNAVVEIKTLDYSEPILPQILHSLYCRRVHSLFVEGGAKLLQSFIDSGLWDEARVFVSPMSVTELYPTINNHEGVNAPELECKSVTETKIHGTVLKQFRNK